MVYFIHSIARPKKWRFFSCRRSYSLSQSATPLLSQLFLSFPGSTLPSLPPSPLFFLLTYFLVSLPLDVKNRDTSPVVAVRVQGLSSSNFSVSLSHMYEEDPAGNTWNLGIPLPYPPLLSPSPIPLPPSPNPSSTPFPPPLSPSPIPLP